MLSAIVILQEIGSSLSPAAPLCPLTLLFPCPFPQPLLLITIGALLLWWPLFQLPCENVGKWYLPACVWAWLISLKLNSSQMATNDKFQSFLWPVTIPLGICMSHFRIHSSVSGHQGWCGFLAIVTGTTLNGNAGTSLMQGFFSFLNPAFQECQRPHRIVSSFNFIAFLVSCWGFYEWIMGTKIIQTKMLLIPAVRLLLDVSCCWCSIHKVWWLWVFSLT